MYASKYVAKKPDPQGIIHYSAEENRIWAKLYDEQIKIVQGRACDEYLEGLRILNMPADRVPQCNDLNDKLERVSHFAVEHVNALIPFEQFFTLLANRQFPAASFMRTPEDFKYIKEPDIFHEYFGHCPMLTNLEYANFMANYGKLAQKANHREQVLLARLYWFTVEFGLIQTKKGLRIYGGGILSSPEETIYAVESPAPMHKPFDALEALRTPYRIDIKQPIYFIIDDYAQLYALLENDLMGLVHKAHKLGDFAPAYA